MVPIWDNRQREEKNMKKSILPKFIPALFTCMLAASGPSYANPAGKVIDEAGKPMAGVSVELLGSGTRTLTDAQGRYDLGGAVSVHPSAGFSGAVARMEGARLVIDLPRAEVVYL